jgi:hypothetical protein
MSSDELPQYSSVRTHHFIYIYIYKTAVGFEPGGSSTTIGHNRIVTHITRINRTSNKRTIQKTTIKDITTSNTETIQTTTTNTTTK